jgi:hypothetical protein
MATPAYLESVEYFTIATTTIIKVAIRATITLVSIVTSRLSFLPSTFIVLPLI